MKGKLAAITKWFVFGQPGVQQRFMSHGIQCWHDDIWCSHFVRVDLNDWHLV